LQSVSEPVSPPFWPSGPFWPLWLGVEPAWLLLFSVLPCWLLGFWSPASPGVAVAPWLPVGLVCAPCLSCVPEAAPGWVWALFSPALLGAGVVSAVVPAGFAGCGVVSVFWAPGVPVWPAASLPGWVTAAFWSPAVFLWGASCPVAPGLPAAGEVGAVCVPPAWGVSWPVVPGVPTTGEPVGFWFPSVLAWGASCPWLAPAGLLVTAGCPPVSSLYQTLQRVLARRIGMILW